MKKIISVSKISRHFQVGKQVVKALKSISISINQNEYVSFMGPSGSGKSTLMNIVGCLDTPTGGEYVLNGKNVLDLDEVGFQAIRGKEVGLIFQDPMSRLNPLMTNATTRHHTYVLPQGTARVLPRGIQKPTHHHT